MKKIIIIFLTGIIFSCTLKGQCDIRMYDIYTPNGKPVVTFLMCESSAATRNYFDTSIAQDWPNARQIKTYDGYSSTRKFNCHGYAWLRVEQNIDRWIGTGWANDIVDPEKAYITNGGYVKVTQPSYPAKVFWASGDHSAVTTSQQGVFISKWNEYPLLEHAWNYSPYGTSNLEYYVKAPPPPAISGPTLICPGSTTYTITATDWQAGYSWNKSSNLMIANVNANTITVYGTASTYASGYVNILYNGTEVARKNIWVGVPEIQMSGPSSVSQSSDALFYCESTSDLVNAYQLYYEWEVYPDIGFYGYGYGPQVYIQFPSYYSNYTVSARASNECGWGDYVSHDVYVSSSPAPSSVYPNPASDVVSIEIDAQAQTSAPAITSGTQLKLDKTYDLRLYDGQGNILRNAKTKGGTVQFNVSALPNGIYYLHIYDGINPKPEIQQIVVEH